MSVVRKRSWPTLSHHGICLREFEKGHGEPQPIRRLTGLPTGDLRILKKKKAFIFLAFSVRH